MPPNHCSTGPSPDVNPPDESPLATEKLIEVVEGMRSGRIAFSLSPTIAERLGPERATQVCETMKAYERTLLAFYEEELAKRLN